MLPIMTYEPLGCNALVAYESLRPWRIYSSHVPPTYDALITYRD
jgi:hypothetical protein